jgi:hypothetical protein
MEKTEGFYWGTKVVGKPDNDYEIVECGRYHNLTEEQEKELEEKMKKMKNYNGSPVYVKNPWITMNIIREEKPSTEP